MSRSFKHQPFMAICGNSSAKRDKQIANKSVRRTHKKVLHNALKAQEFDVVLPLRLECSHNNVWGWTRDGKQRYQGLGARDWFEYYKSIFDPADVWYGDERFAVWPPSWYTDMMRK